VENTTNDNDLAVLLKQV